ncbi:purple acid phosphatase family protein [Paenibacillus rigui]|uniref:Metallophosphoesterase n=1 Tax=Paenibacillus rigui TaxID=554312 RepID=A0A229ULZ1_9BACL|nr:metallophosphoesterase family protein [Paenibacillus rigui]OXM84487.1 metallophosphoesterase [Paenibacillus rigui]
MNKRSRWGLGILLVLLCLVIAGALWLERQKGAGAGEQALKPHSIVTSISGDPRTSRSFTWFTDDAAAGSVIQWIKGAAANGFEGGEAMEAAGSAAAIKTGEKTVRGVHKISLTGLTPGTEYTYRVGSGKPGGWSEAQTFTTEGEAEQGFSFINVTDSQGETKTDFELWGRTLDKAFSIFPQARFIVHNGDLTEDPTDEAAWRDFFEAGKRWLTRIPMQPVTGNHDEIDKNADRFGAHFMLPANGAERSNPGTTYSFDYGNAHIVVLNTESNMDIQTEWLRKDLSATDKPWKIVAMHRGAYGGSSYKKAVEKWVPLFDEFKVDLVLQGHNHEYSRSYPLRGGKVTGDGVAPVTGRQGTVYVVTNTSGPKFNEKKDDQWYHKVHFQNGVQMFAGITVEGGTLTYEAYDATGKRLDTFRIQH